MVWSKIFVSQISGILVFAPEASGMLERVLGYFNLSYTRLRSVLVLAT